MAASFRAFAPGCPPPVSPLGWSFGAIVALVPGFLPFHPGQVPHREKATEALHRKVVLEGCPSIPTR